MQCKTARTLAIVILLLVLAPVCAPCAKIKRRSGEMLVGAVQGVIVLKTGPEFDPSGARATATYAAFSGDAVDAIDEAGFAVAAGKTLGLLLTTEERNTINEYQPGVLPHDAAILQKVLNVRAFRDYMKLEQRQGAVSEFPGGRLIVARPDIRLIKLPPYRLLGEFQPGEGWGLIVPALQVRTAGGIVTIPVADVSTSGEPSSALEQRQRGATGDDTCAQDIVLAAKTVAVVAVEDQASLAGNLKQEELPDAETSKREIERAVRSWKRYALVPKNENPDLILKIVTFASGELLAVQEWGKTEGRKGRLLWLRDVRRQSALHAFAVLRREIEQAQEQRPR